MRIALFMACLADTVKTVHRADTLATTKDAA